MRNFIIGLLGILQFLAAEKSWRDFVDEDYLKVQLAIEQDLPLTEGKVFMYEPLRVRI